MGSSLPGRRKTRTNRLAMGPGGRRAADRASADLLEADDDLRDLYASGVTDAGEHDPDPVDDVDGEP